MKKHLLFAWLLLVAATLQAQTPKATSADTYYLKIRYLFESDLSQALEDYVNEYNVGDLYAVPSPALEGYRPNTDTIKGKMPDHDVVDTVLYMANTYEVTTKSEPDEGGTTTGGGTYGYNEEVTVTATANEGFTFLNWTKDGEVVGTETNYTFNVTSDITLVANFEVSGGPTVYTITANASPSNGGTVTGAGQYESGEQCTLVADANEGYNFVKWTESGSQVSTNDHYTFTVTGNRSLVAVFQVQSPVTHSVTVSPLMSHGTISVSPSGQVEVGTTVTITVTPEEGYVLGSLLVYNKDDVSQNVELNGLTFVMPDFDVMISAVFEIEGGLPVINGDITAPAPICAGDVLDLTAPSVSDATEQGWQMSAHSNFNVIEVYEGQPLDASYNGWKLRYMASNAMGEVYSNVVTITVKDMSNMTLSGDLSSCTGLACTYTVTHAGDAVLTWEVTDDKAVVDPSGRSLTVLWGSKGAQKVSVLAEDPESGCSVELSLDVTVQSYIEEDDVQNIVAKKHDGKDYLLIYPNPKDTYKYQWYKDGKAIAGANGQYYYPAEGLADGDYQVYISFNADAQGNLFCGAFSAVYTVGGTKAVYAIYPNPALTGEGLVVVNEGDEAELFVYTLDGKLVHRQVVANGRQTIGVVLPQGVYVVRFNDGENVTTERVVIQ